MAKSQIAQTAKILTPTISAIIKREMSDKARPFGVDTKYIRQAIQKNRSRDAVAELTERSMKDLGYTPTEAAKAKREFYKSDKEILKEKIHSDAEKIVKGFIPNDLPKHQERKAIQQTRKMLSDAYKLQKEDEPRQRFETQQKMLLNVEKRLRIIENSIIRQQGQTYYDSGIEAYYKDPNKTASERLQGIERRVSSLEISKVQSDLKQGSVEHLTQAVRSTQDMMSVQRKVAHQHGAKIETIEEKQSSTDTEIENLKQQLNLQNKVLNKLLEERKITKSSYVEKLQNEDETSKSAPKGRTS